MKLSVVISVKNRIKYLNRTLNLLKKQTMNNSDFELVIVDDNSNDNILELLKSYNCFNIKYIKIDSKLIEHPIFWGPSISNNIGFKAASGEVLMITGPEILHKETNFEYGYESAMNNKIAFAHVYHSGQYFTKLLENNNLMNESFDDLLKLPNAMESDITHNTFYWFICTVKKEHVMKINGCDEEYMKGICGDDDDFVNRIEAFGVPRMHDFRMIGIHQDHSNENNLDPLRIRRSAEWEKARILNTKYLEDWNTIRKSTPFANIDCDWGSNKVILLKIQLEKI